MNRASQSCFTLVALVALILAGSTNFAAAQRLNDDGTSSRSAARNAKPRRPAPLPPVVPLTDGSWNVDASGVWSLATNWLGSSIADGVAATGNFLFDITATRTITIDGAVASRTLGIMNIGDTNASNNYTIAASGGATLTFDNGGSNAQINVASTAGTNTIISAPVSLTSSLDVSNASANTLTISGAISGGGSLTNASGITALTLVNTYSGNTTITGGRISVDGDATLGNGAGTLFLSGGAFNTSVSRTPSTAPVSNNVVVTADSSITTTSSAGNVDLNFTGTLTGTGGTLTFNNLGGDAAADSFDPRFSGGNFTMSRPIVLTGTIGTVRLSDFNTAGTTHTYDGVISGTGSFRRSASPPGTGGVTVFTAANTYTGGTAINDGTLQLGNGGATGSLSTSSAITILSNGRFKISQNDSVVQGVDFSGAAITGAGIFEHAGSGNVTLNVANTYSGGTIVSGGVFAATHAPSGVTELIATADGALGGGNVSLTASGVRLTLQGGVTNNYISDNATLSMVTGSDANLNFALGQTDVISGLVLGGAAQSDPGTYGSTASGAVFVFDSFFTGTGTLTLIPEPSTWAMTIMGAGLLLGVQRFRRKRS